MLNKIVFILSLALLLTSLGFCEDINNPTVYAQQSSFITNLFHSFTINLQTPSNYQNNFESEFTNSINPLSGDPDGGNNVDLRRGHRIRKKITAEKKNSCTTYK
ncbi:MAG: hypothetical protein U9P79_03330 [Candidatus Cloacimonadota bacterium]|nr:hypothetical protein [Candidatus Cloacimonadota bacterium]